MDNINKHYHALAFFDLDGTLWDSTGCVCAIWNRVLNKYEDISLMITQ